MLIVENNRPERAAATYKKKSYDKCIIGMEKTTKILVVDDDERNLRLMEAILLPMGYEVVLAHDGEEALKQAREVFPDVVLLDVMMPKMDGFEVAKQLKEHAETKLIPVVMVTALREVEDRVKALEAGADDFMSKPIDRTELIATVNSQLKVKAYNDHMSNYQKELETEVVKRTEELQQAIERIRKASLDTIYMLSNAAEFKDAQTGAHIKRMSSYAAAIARSLGLDASTVETILYAAPMHDIGKIGTPDRIIMKPIKLDTDEWNIMKQHVIIGAKILETSDAEFIKVAKVIALTHHERWDGNGYPGGLRGTSIPLAGRITSIADVFDALTNRRPYKPAFSIEESFQIISNGRGSQFDPEVVDMFLEIRNEILSIKEQYGS